MTTRSRTVMAVLAACFMLSVAGIAAAQYSVVAVMPDGSVILNGPNGVKSYAVPAGTQFTADGRSGLALTDLRPGMNVSGKESGIDNWKGTDVMVHNEMNAKVMAAAGNSLLIRGRNGVERYQWNDASDITIIKDGRVVDASSVRVGDRITGMIVQKAAPGMKGSAPAQAASAPAPAPKKAAPAPAPAAAAAPAPAPAPAAAPAAESAPAPAKAKKLPKTASEVPALGLLGVLALATGAGLTTIRKSRSGK
ncbi:MAG TPA: LPXTG cell wall anchor domain-containing protein [Thermoanaerobaculia bacterium]|nr:LPXTG cell wall anchor domain-containing protein [Thermoanaerobaculia bacterium]